MRHYLLVIMSLFLSGCLGMPEGVIPVDGFETNRYLGKWYEIARLDHSFERGLDSVSAEYSRRDDGGLTVVNKGFSITDNKWKTAVGKAYFVDESEVGHLKVSFFGPFYSSYVIFELDKEHYQYAFVSGYNNSYLWLLSRKPTVSHEVMEHFIKRSRELGFDIDKLILVKHAIY